MTLSLVIPTFNERENLSGLVASIDRILEAAQIDYEIIVVDDSSPDGTGQLAQELSQTYPLRLLQRRGKLGLSSAIIEGWTQARGELLGVIDADGSHDERLLPEMVHWVRNSAELAIGSRYVSGGGLGDWPFHRRWVSRLAVGLALPLTSARDRTSGFFVFRRSVLDNVELDPIGHKIGLEVQVRGRFEYFVELPYVFKERMRPRSATTSREVFSYLLQLGRLSLYWLPRRPRRKRLVH